MKKIFALLTFICGLWEVHAQQLTNEGTEFYVAFTQMYDQTNAVFEINISSRVTANGNVEITGTGFSQNFVVNPGVVTTVTIPSVDANINLSEVIMERAIHITADNPITVYASTFHNARSEASICLPVTALASDYMVTTYPTVIKNSVWYQSEFMVVAGNQPCDVTIIPSCPTQGGVPAGTPISVSLNPNEIYQVKAQTGANNDLTGSTVVADNGTDKFAVFNGHVWIYLSSCGNLNADPLFEQCYPTQSWGKEYILTLTEEQNENAYRVIAKEDGTTFTVNGVPTGPVLNTGDVYDGTFSIEAIEIESNVPVAVTQTMTTGVCSGNGDPSMVVINSNEQMYLDTVTFYAATGGSNLVNYCNVVTRSTDTSTMQFNTAPITNWTILPADPEYSYKIFATGVGSHTITTTGCGFLAYAYGMGNPESYFYAAGARVNAVDDSLSFTNVNTSLPASCDLDSIEFTPFTSGGDVLSYHWYFGDGDSSQVQQPVHVYTDAGDYEVTLIVQYLCFTDTIVDTLHLEDSPLVTATGNDVTCYNWSNGSIDVTVNGGLPTYNYQWSNGATTEDLSGLPGDTYNLTVTDQNGCTGYASVFIDEPAPIIVDVDPAGPFAPPDGPQNVTASPPGGTWSANCGACIDPVTGEFDPAVANVGVWQVCYTVTVGGCDSSDCINIQVDTSCAMATYSNEPTCYGFSDGSFTANVSGGLGTINFVFSDDQGTQVNQGNSNTANNLGEGWYYISVTDDICNFNDSIYIDEPDQIVIDLVITDPLCNGESTGIALVDSVHNATGSYNGISYYWNPNPVGPNGLGISEMDGIPAGTYNLTVNDANGCSEQIDFTVNEPPVLAFSEIGYDPAYCRQFYYQSGNGVVFAAATGGTPDYDYEWLNVYTLQTSNNTTWGGLNPSLYKITVTDNNGCELTQFITLDSLSPEADFEMTSDQFSPPGTYQGTAIVDVHFVNQSQYFANPNNPNADTTFFWYFDLPNYNWILSEDYYEEFDRSYLDSGTYEICLVAINKNGCKDTTCKEILVFDQPELTLPNVFTPGSNGVNDVFFFPNTAMVEFECVIVNRCGNVIFEFEDINDQWNGTDKQGNECSDGVYFYKYKATATNGQEFEGQGNIHLIREK